MQSAQINGVAVRREGRGKRHFLQRHVAGKNAARDSSDARTRWSNVIITGAGVQTCSGRVKLYFLLILHPRHLSNVKEDILGTDLAHGLLAIHGLHV